MIQFDFRIFFKGVGSTTTYLYRGYNLLSTSRTSQWPLTTNQVLGSHPPSSRFPGGKTEAKTGRWRGRPTTWPGGAWIFCTVPDAGFFGALGGFPSDSLSSWEKIIGHIFLWGKSGKGLDLFSWWCFFFNRILQTMGFINSSPFFTTISENLFGSLFFSSKHRVFGRKSKLGRGKDWGWKGWGWSVHQFDTSGRTIPIGSMGRTVYLPTKWP